MDAEGKMIAVVGALLMAALGLIGYRICAADGRVDGCYISHTWFSTPTGGSSVFTLWGHRSWRPDTELGRFTTYGDTVAASERIQCPIMAGK